MSEAITKTPDHIDSDTGEILHEYNLKTVSAAFKSTRFWQYFALLTLGNIFGGIFSYQWKPIGLAHKQGDEFLTWAGSISSIT